MNCGHSLSALTHMWCVWVQSFCVSRSVLTELFRTSGPVTPLPPQKSVTSLLIIVSLLLNPPLWADEWTQGDEVTAGLLFLSQGIWEVFYLSEEVALGLDGELFKPIIKHSHPKFQFHFHLNRCPVKKLDTLAHNTTVFQIICAHSCEDSTTCMLPARFW